jgi:DNA-directed RNA polymerase specialized sigma24 family protein
MDIPAEQAMSNREGPLVSLVRSLIVCAGDREGDRLKTAFYDCFKEKFYDRLKKSTSRLYGGIPDWEARMEEVFNDTFLVAFEELKSFQVGDAWDDSECQKVILNWMSVIANNLLLKVARSARKEMNALKVYKAELKYELISRKEEERKNHKQTYDRVKFAEFWNNLNPMSKEILLICIEQGTVKDEAGSYISDKEVDLLKVKNDLDSCALPSEVKKFMDKNDFKEKNTDHLTDDALNYLEAKYKVKRPSIRKAKQRALEGLRDCKI